MISVMPFPHEMYSGFLFFFYVLIAYSETFFFCSSRLECSWNATTLIESISASQSKNVFSLSRVFISIRGCNGTTNWLVYFLGVVLFSTISSHSTKLGIVSPESSSSASHATATTELRGRNGAPNVRAKRFPLGFSSATITNTRQHYVCYVVCFFAIFLLLR